MKTILAAAALALAAAACAHPDPKILERTDARFADFRIGMTQDQATAILGRPDQVMAFPLSGQVAWSYIYWDSFGYLLEHSINFGPDGRMVGRTLRRMNDGGDMK